MGRVVAAKLILGRLDEVGGVLDEEFQLLRQPSPNNRVVLLKAHLQRFARHELLVDEVGDHAAQLIRAGLAKPLLAPGFDQPPHVAIGDPHRFDAASIALIAVEPGVCGEQDRPGGDEVEEGFPE